MSTKTLNKVGDFMTSKKKILSSVILLSTSLALFNMSQHVFAKDDYVVKDGQLTVTIDGTKQDDEKGNLVLTVPKQDPSAKGKSFKIYKIFNTGKLDSANGPTKYTWNDTYKTVVQDTIFNFLTEDYKKSHKLSASKDITETIAIDYMQSLSNNKFDTSDFRKLLSAIRDAFVKANLKGDMFLLSSLDGDNKMTIDGLTYGYYFVDEVVKDSEKKDDSDSKIKDIKFTYNPFLTLINGNNKSSEVTLRSDYPSIRNEVEDKQKSQSWVNMTDYQIGKTIVYANDVKLPDMKSYPRYYMSLENKLDEALTFHADKEKIKVTITKTNDDGSETSYTLKSNEFNLQTVGDNVTTKVNGGKKADNFDKKSTFNIEFEDLKAIIDRELFNVNGQSKANFVYDDVKFHVEYEAHLNDLTISKTGRKGITTDSRVIFYNRDGVKDAENISANATTLKTPWSSSVVFTYGLNGVTIGKGDEKIKGIKYRLYEDEAMTKEVKVHKVSASNDFNAPAYTPLEEGDSSDGELIDSNDKGEFSIIGLSSGKYFLKEDKVMNGYVLSKDPLMIEIKSSFNEDRNTYVKENNSHNNVLTSLSANFKSTEFYHRVFNLDQKDLDTDVDKGIVKVSIEKASNAKSDLIGGKMLGSLITFGAMLITFVFYVFTKKVDYDKYRF